MRAALEPIPHFEMMSEILRDNMSRMVLMPFLLSASRSHLLMLPMMETSPASTALLLPNAFHGYADDPYVGVGTSAPFLMPAMPARATFRASS